MRRSYIRQRRCPTLLILVALSLARVIQVSGEAYAQTPFSEEAVRKVDQIMQATFPAEEPGASVIVEQAGRTVLREGYGMADLELGVAVDPSMVFRIGSVTKQVTALAVMRLVERGDLTVEDPVTHYVTGLPDRFGTVRIRHLLSHTSGIPDYFHTARFDSLIEMDYHYIVNEELDLGKILSIISNSNLGYEPGAQYSYSNSNYFLLAMAIEKASGMPYFDFIRQEICEPAGMEQTYYIANDKFIPGRVSDHVEYEGQIIKNPHRCMGSTMGFGCGGLWSCVDDLARYNRALEAGQLVSLGTLTEMSEPFTFDDGTPSRYGLGWQTAKLKGREIAFHGGDYLGYSALILRVPSDSIFIAILSNDGRLHAYNLEFPAKKAAAVLLGAPFPEWKAIDMPPETLEKYAGTYRIDEANAREFIVEDGRAYTSRNGRPRLDIFPASDTTFFYTVTLHNIEFEMDEDGAPVKMILHRDDGTDQVAERVE